MCCLWLTDHLSARQPSLKPSIPLGLPDETWERYVPRNNPMTPAKIELGRKLFFDRRPSAEGRVSRSSWRDSKFALTGGRAVSERGLKKERRIVGRPYLSSGEPSLRDDSREGV